MHKVFVLPTGSEDQTKVGHMAKVSLREMGVRWRNILWIWKTENATKRHYCVAHYLQHNWTSVWFRARFWWVQAGFDGECQALSVLVCLTANATGTTELALSPRFILEQAGGFHPNTKDCCSIAPLCMWLNFTLTEPTFSRLWLTNTKPYNDFKTYLVIICFQHQWVGKERCDIFILSTCFLCHFLLITSQPKSF